LYWTNYANVLGLQQGMLARLALALQNGQLQGIEGVGGQGFGGEGGTIVVDENCSVSTAI